MLLAEASGRIVHANAAVHAMLGTGVLPRAVRVGLSCRRARPAGGAPLAGQLYDGAGPMMGLALPRGLEPLFSP
jgi:hypothetical protein